MLKWYWSDRVSVLRELLKLLICSLAMICLAIAFFFLAAWEDAPTVGAGGPPTPEDVTKTREFVRGVRSTVQSGLSEPATFVTNEEQLNKVIKLRARFVPGFRGKLEVRENSVHGSASIPVPNTQKWINLRASAAEFQTTFALSSVQIGPIALASEIALEVARIGGNVIVGERFGDTVLDSAKSMRIEADQLAFELTMDEIGRNGLMHGVFSTLRGSEVPDASVIDHYYLRIREAMESGELPSVGSFSPHLWFTLEPARGGIHSHGVENAYTSAIFALTLFCGARDFP